MSVVPHKSCRSSSVEKESVAQEKAGLLDVESPLSNAPDCDHWWAINRYCTHEARLQSELLLSDVGI